MKVLITGMKIIYDFIKKVYIEISIIKNVNTINTIEQLDKIDKFIEFITQSYPNVEFKKLIFDSEIEFWINKISLKVKSTFQPYKTDDNNNESKILNHFTSEKSAVDYLENEMDSYTYMMDYTKRVGYHDDVESLRNYHKIMDEFCHEDGDYDTVVYINNCKCFIGYGFRYSDY